MRCVFFGSPDFAVASLEKLVSSRHTVAGVVTQPDRPAGRGLKLEAPAVKKFAEARGIPVFQPEKVNCEATLDFLRQLSPEILVVVAYSGFLGPKLLTYCGRPPVNVHPSLLPDLRGAAPMQWSLIRGYKTTGITTQYMIKEMDAGDVLMQKEYSIGENETAKELHDRLGPEGGALLVDTLSAIEAGTAAPKPQNGEKATYAPLLSKDLGKVSWQEQDAATVHNLARGLYPWPGAYTLVNNKRVKILKTTTAAKSWKALAPGEFSFDGTALAVGCKSGVLLVHELQPEGKKAQLPQEFVNGMTNLGLSRFDLEVQ